MEYVLVKSVGPQSCGLSHEHRAWRIFPSPSVSMQNCEGGDKVGVTIYLPSGNFAENRTFETYCHLYGAQGQRQTYL
ncbi:uncharacterized protein TNCV_396241 [Trichonephila clavipes]|nr:uncharacterized protein TNCV_396241 [Trichonephila clavipes]